MTDGRARSTAGDAQPIRVLVVDDHPLFLEGLRASLEDAGRIEIVGQATDGLQAVTEAQRLRPDVILMDIGLPGMTGLDATRRLRQAAPESRIIGLTMHESKEYAVKMLQAGAKGYLIKVVSPRTIIQAIESVYGGGTFLCPSVSERLQGEAEPVSDSREGEPLSVREKEILGKVAGGMTNREIAAALCLSLRTVETYRERISAKLGIRTVAGLTSYAVAHGLTRAE